MDPIRRKILKAGAAMTAMVAAPRVFGEQTRPGGNAMSFYEKGRVRIRYEETGSGFPLLLIPGGGLNSTIAARQTPLTPSTSSKESTVASRRICAMPMPASPPARLR